MSNKNKFHFYALKLCIILIIIYVIQVLINGFTEMFFLNKLSFSEPWRFITAISLHGSLTHLLYNLFALALFGSILERFLGEKKFLIIFFISGIGANLISVNFYNSSLGASGAIYGILGTLTIIRPLMMIWSFGFPLPMFLASILWVFGSFIGIFIPSDVGHIAHLTGIIFGFILGIIYRKKFIRIWKIKKRNEMKLNESYVKNWEDRYILGK